MAEDKRSPEEQENSGFTPSSPVKRTLAWTGLAYALILLILTTYIYFNGAGLRNLGPLLTLPGLIGMGALALVSWKSTGRPGKWPAIGLAVFCWLMALATLPIGIAGLMSNFPELAAVIVSQ